MGPFADQLISADLDTVRLEARLCWIDALAVLSADPLPPQALRGDLAAMCAGELLEDLSDVTPLSINGYWPNVPVSRRN